MFDPSEIYECASISDCCGAEIKLGDICCDCGEHCTPIEYDGDGWNQEPEAWAGGFADNH